MDGCFYFQNSPLLSLKARNELLDVDMPYVLGPRLHMRGLDAVNTVVKNYEFCFIPFVLGVRKSQKDIEADYDRLRNLLDSSEYWDKAQDEVRYLFSYVCDKFPIKPNENVHDRRDGAKRDAPQGERAPAAGDAPQGEQVLHYRLKERTLISLGFGRKARWDNGGFRNGAGKWCSWKGTKHICIHIDSIDLYVFKTSVNILQIEMHFDTADAMDIPSNLFHLKNISSYRSSGIIPQSNSWTCEELRAYAQFPEKRGITFDEITRFLIKHIDDGLRPELLFYANEGCGKMNILAYAELPMDTAAEEVTRKLFYLGNCYNNSYIYSSSHCIPSNAHWQSPDIAWGYSSEALACVTLCGQAIVRAAKGSGAHHSMGEWEHRRFIKRTFIKNVKSNYRFMYLILLHQKYAYYLLLTRLGAGQDKDVEVLEDYKSQLETLRTNFAFSRVSEAAQYQQLYAKLSEEFKLADIDRDVNDPLVTLTQLKHDEEERQDRRRERDMNHALALLAVLSIISCVCDGVSLFGASLEWFVVALIVTVVPIAVFTRSLWLRDWTSDQSKD